jgi:hypothetical protein
MEGSGRGSQRFRPPLVVFVVPTQAPRLHWSRRVDAAVVAPSRLGAAGGRSRRWVAERAAHWVGSPQEAACPPARETSQSSAPSHGLPLSLLRPPCTGAPAGAPKQASRCSAGSRPSRRTPRAPAVVGATGRRHRMQRDRGRRRGRDLVEGCDSPAALCRSHGHEVTDLHSATAWRPTPSASDGPSRVEAAGSRVSGEEPGSHRPRHSPAEASARRIRVGSGADRGELSAAARRGRASGSYGPPEPHRSPVAGRTVTRVTFAMGNSLEYCTCRQDGRTSPPSSISPPSTRTGFPHEVLTWLCARLPPTGTSPPRTPQGRALGGGRHADALVISSTRSAPRRSRAEP